MSQEPDGAEIVASMQRAVINGKWTEWTETCYCNPPLRHERSAIYDQFFTNMEVQPLAEPVTHDGPKFWQYLQNSAGKNSQEQSISPISSRIRYVPMRIL